MMQRLKLHTALWQFLARSVASAYGAHVNYLTEHRGARSFFSEFVLQKSLFHPACSRDCVFKNRDFGATTHLLVVK